MNSDAQLFGCGAPPKETRGSEDLVEHIRDIVPADASPLVCTQSPADTDSGATIFSRSRRQCLR
jgi:hypothetical protein